MSGPLVVAALSLLGQMSQPVDTSVPSRVATYTAVVHEGHLLDGRPFRLEIRLVPYNAASHQQTEFFGGEVTEPQFVVERVGLSVGGRQVSIPPEAVTDLYDVHLPSGVRLYEAGPFVVLRLQGGDGAGSYEARLVIDAGKLVRREGTIRGEPLPAKTWTLGARKKGIALR